MQTFDIPWEELLLHYYEAGIENLSYNEVYDLAIQEYLPEFVNQAEEEDTEFAQALIKEQNSSVEAKRAKDKAKAALEAATQAMADSASTIADKAQSIRESLDKRVAPPIKKSVKFESEDPDKA